MPWILVQVENDVWMYGGCMVDVWWMYGCMDVCMFIYMYVLYVCMYACMQVCRCSGCMYGIWQAEQHWCMQVNIGDESIQRLCNHHWVLVDTGRESV
jgi:hypothetical protein